MSKLKPYTAEEFSDRFEILYKGDKKPFIVAKRGLSRNKLDSIRKGATSFKGATQPAPSAPVKNTAAFMNKGGIVRNYQVGGIVEDMTPTELEEAAQVSLPIDIRNTPVETAIALGTLNEGLAPDQLGADQTNLALALNTMDQSVPTPPDISPEAALESSVENYLAQEAANQLSVAAEKEAERAVLPPSPPPVTPKPTPTSRGPVQAITAVKEEEKPESVRIYEEGLASQQKALEDMAFMEATKANLERDYLAKQEIIKQQKLEEYETKLNTIQEKRQALAKEILEGREDPNRLWHSMDAGRQFGAIAGIMLSGIGSAIAGRGGQNAALAIFQKAIDRDIEAQRQDLGRKKSILSDYIAQGVELRDAFKLASAEMKENVALHLSKIAAEVGGPAAKIKADMDAAKLNMAAAKEREDVLSKSIENKYKAEGLLLDIDYKRNAMDISRRQVAVAENTLKAKEAETARKLKAEETLRQQRGEMAKSPDGMLVTAESYYNLKEDARKNTVIMPSLPGDAEGTFRVLLAKDSKSKDKATELIAGSTSVQNGITRMLAEIDAPGARSVGDKRARLETMWAGILAGVKQMEHLGTLDAGVESLMKKMIGDPTAFFSLDTSLKTKLEEARHLFTDKYNNQLNGYVIAPPRSMQPQAATGAVQGGIPPVDPQETKNKYGFSK